jgi:hypothetical protein
LEDLNLNDRVTLVMDMDVRQARIKAAFLKALDRSIDSVGSTVLAECFGDIIGTGALDNALEGDFIAAFGTAKQSIEVYRI